MISTPQLLGQTIVVVGGSSGIGLATARRARVEGAEVIITARDPGRLHRAGLSLGASIAAFDATDFDRLATFFAQLPTPIDHVLVTGPAPHDTPLTSCDAEAIRRDVEAHLLLPLHVAMQARGVVRAGGTVLLMGCAGVRASMSRSPLTAALTAALSSLTTALAGDLDPVRVNLIVSGIVDPTPVAAIVDEGAMTRHLRLTRAIAPADVAALAVHLMANAAITGATYDIEGGEHHVTSSATP